MVCRSIYCDLANIWITFSCNGEIFPPKLYLIGEAGGFIVFRVVIEFDVTADDMGTAQSFIEYKVTLFLLP